MGQLIDRLTQQPVRVAYTAEGDEDFVTPEVATERLTSGQYKTVESRLVARSGERHALGPFDARAWREHGLVVATDEDADAFLAPRTAAAQAAREAQARRTRREGQIADVRRRVKHEMFRVGERDPGDLEEGEINRIAATVLRGEPVLSDDERRGIVRALREDRDRPREAWEREQRIAIEEANETAIARRAEERHVGRLMAFGIGMSRGGLMEIPALAAAIAGPEYARAIQEAEREFPVATGVGQLAGAIAGLPGGALAEVGGLAARAGARVAGGVAARAGLATAERMAMRALGVGAIGAAETVTRTGAAGLVDLAARGADITDERSLGDRRALGQSILAQIPEGALWAAGIDLGLGAVGRGITTATRFLLGVPGRTGVSRVARATTGADTVDFLAARSAGGFRKDTRLAEEAADLGGFTGMGRHGTRLGYLAGDPSRAQELASAGAHRIGEQIAATYRTLDRAARAEGGDASWMAVDYVRRALREVVRPLRRQATDAAEVNARAAVRELYVFARRAGVLREVIGDLGVRAPARFPRPRRIGVEWLWEQRKALDNIAFRAGARDAPARLANRADALQMLRRSLARTVDDGVDNWARRFGEAPDARETIRALNRDYRVSVWWRRATGTRMLSEMTNRAASLTDMLAATAGAAAGSTFGDAKGGADDTAYAVIGGIAAGVLNKTARTRFPAWAAIAGNRMMALGLIDNARQGTRSRVREIVEGVRRRDLQPAGFFLLFDRIRAKLQGEAREVFERIRDTANDPGAVLESATRQTEAFAHAAPETAAMVAQTAHRATRWLAESIPRPIPGDPLRTTDAPRYRETDIDSFARRMTVVSDPLATIEAALAGEWSPETREGIEVVWSSLRDDVALDIADTASRDPQAFADLPYGSRVAFGMLLGARTDASLSPRFLSTLDAVMQVAQAQEVAPSAIPQSAQGRGKLFARSFGEAEGRA